MHLALLGALRLVADRAERHKVGRAALDAGFFLAALDAMNVTRLRLVDD
jgi:hypothetical protein